MKFRFFGKNHESIFLLSRPGCMCERAKEMAEEEERTQKCSLRLRANGARKRNRITTFSPERGDFCFYQNCISGMSIHWKRVKILHNTCSQLPYAAHHITTGSALWRGNQWIECVFSRLKIDYCARHRIWLNMAVMGLHIERSLNSSSSHHRCIELSSSLERHKSIYLSRILIIIREYSEIHSLHFSLARGTRMYIRKKKSRNKWKIEARI